MINGAQVLLITDHLSYYFNLMFTSFTLLLEYTQFLENTVLDNILIVGL